MIEVYKENQTQSYKDLIFTAWHMVAFDRQKKLASLTDIYRKMDNKLVSKTQSSEEMLNVVKSLNALYGGEVIE